LVALFKENQMKYLFFVFVLNFCACATTAAARTPANDDSADRLKALAIFGVTATGTGYVENDSLMSIQCASSEGDAALGAKAALRLAHDEIAKMRCGTARANHFVPEDLVLSSSGRVSCLKFALKVSRVECQSGK
jgi:hypothetical protein